jgi:hypothetical protein
MRTGFPLTLSLLLAGCHMGGIHVDKTFDDDVDAVVVLLDSGDIDVHGVDEGPTRVQVDVGGVGSEIQGMSLEHGVLTVDYRCGIGCGGDLWLEVPSHVDVEVQLERGDVWLDTIHGTVRGRLGAGDFWASSLGSSDVAVAVGAGDLGIETTGKPLSLWADLGAGDASLSVKAGGYRMVDMEVGAGELWMDDVYADEGAPGRIHVRAGAGAVWLSGDAGTAARDSDHEH